MSQTTQIPEKTLDLNIDEPVERGSIPEMARQVQQLVSSIFMSEEYIAVIQLNFVYASQLIKFRLRHRNNLPHSQPPTYRPRQRIIRFGCRSESSAKNPYGYGNYRNHLQEYNKQNEPLWGLQPQNIQQFHGLLSISSPSSSRTQRRTRQVRSLYSYLDTPDTRG